MKSKCVKATFVLLFRHIQNGLQQCWIIHTQQPLVLLELGYHHMEKELLHYPLSDILRNGTGCCEYKSPNGTCMLSI